METFDDVALRRRLNRILDHVQTVRAWAMQSTELPAAERVKLLAHLAHLERATLHLLHTSQSMQRQPSLPEDP